MSKNFEEAYIELAQNEIPDLWDRIEAGLTEKSAPEKPVKNKMKVTFFLKQYAGLAAAVVCIALILPAAMLIRRSGGKGYSSNMEGIAQDCNMAAEQAIEGAYDRSAVQDASMEEEAGVEESAIASGAEADNGAHRADSKAGADDGNKAYRAVPEAEADNGKEAYDAAAKAETAGSGDADDTSESKKEMTDLALETQQAAAVESEAAYDQESGIVLKNVIVQVIAENNDVYGEDGSALGGTVYTAVIVKDASGTFAEGEQIEVYLSAASSIKIPVDSEAEIDIYCGESRIDPYVADRVFLLEESTTPQQAAGY